MVGYASIAFFGPGRREPTRRLPRRRRAGDTLLALARGAIEQALGRGPGATPDAAWLREAGAVFVTLRRDGELRGCVGSLEPHRPLAEDVAANAVAAAFRDPRFPPLAASELAGLVVEVSLIGAAEPLAFRDAPTSSRSSCPARTA